jgi:undecaprenyl-diphosphatase
MFIIGGIIFLIVEKFYDENKKHHTLDVEDVTYKQAAWIGIAQIAALIPGTSRAGLV